MATIGFIGLGNMGAPMAANLVKAGHQVTGYDLVAGADGGVAANGRAGRGSAAEAAAAGRHRDHDAAGRAAGAAGLSRAGWGYRRARRKGALLIDCSTIDVETARAVAAAAAQRGFDMLDAPVSGGTVGAAAGTLTFMVGGEADGFRTRPADPASDGPDDRPCRAVGQRPGGQDMQQHDPRDIDDRVCEAFTPGREARTDRRRPYSISSASRQDNAGP